MLEVSIDHAELGRLADEFAATPVQVELSIRRANQRAGRALKTMVGRELKDELDLRTMKYIRRRLRDATRGGVSIWVGLNSLPIVAFKGRPQQTSAGVKVGEQLAEGAFLAMGGAWWRDGPDRFPISTATVPISEAGKAVLEAKVWPRMKEVFVDTFVQELRARTLFGVGAS